MRAQSMEGPLPDFVDAQPAENLAPPLLRRPIHKRDEPANTSPSDQLGSVLAYLGVLHAQLKEEEQRVQQATSTPEPGRKVLQEKRLSRSGTPLDAVLGRYGFPPPEQPAASFLAPDPGILPESGWMEVPPDLTGYDHWPPAPPPVWRPSLLAAAPDAAPAPRAWTRWLLPFAAGLLVAGSFAVGSLLWRTRALPPTQAAARQAATAADDYPADQTVSDDALAAADQTLDALNRGDFARASAVLADAHRRNLGLPGLSYQVALLASRRGDADGLDYWTERSIQAHEAVSECWYLRAFDQHGRSDFPGATESLAAAAHFAPFSPRYAFFWAEYLRRTGQPALALPHFQQALRCRPSTSDTDLILFRQRLARLEIGSDTAFQTELAQHLAHAPVSGDTWLLGAAREISRAAYPAAAEDLRRAAAVLPPLVFRARLHDYFFESQSTRPDLAPFFASPVPAPATGPPSHKTAVPILVDPATRSLAEADPAGW